MKLAKKMMKTSLFGWEDSYFGGYERVIYDHPFIEIPPSIGYDFKISAGLTWYTADKLCKMFLLKLCKMGYLTKFLTGLIKEEKTTLTGEVVTIFNVDKTSQASCIKFVMDDDDELGNLFQHYRDFLKKVDFFFTISGEDEKQGKGGKPGDSEEMDEAQVQKMGVDLFKEIESTTPSWLKPPSALSGRLKENTKFVVMDKKTSPVRYTSDNIRMGNSLVSMLDISFEPKDDIIQNLICGKMSDESGSMRGSRQEMQHQLFKTLYYAFSQILPPQKMFFYGHSGCDTPEVRVYHELYNPNFEYTIERQMRNSYRENYDGPVIENIYDRVRQQTSDNIIFISISDGQPSGHGYGGEKAINDFFFQAEDGIRDGFVTVGVGLYYGQVKDIYSYYTIVNDMDVLVKNVSSLINRVVKTEFKD